MPEKEETNPILAKWINGDLPPEKVKELEKKEGIDQLKIALEQIDNWQLPKHSRCATEIISIPESKYGNTVSWRPFLQIAAVISLVSFAIIFWLVDSSGIQEYQTLTGEQLQIKLPDGSEVTLDALSSLSFNEKAWDLNRNVDLKGQAFFNIESGSDFSVFSQNGTVSVLGTIFSVSSRKDRFDVSCFEGSVGVKISGMEQVLTAGEKSTLSNGILEKVLSDHENPTWLNGFTRFEEERFDIVFEELLMRYEIEGELPAKYHEVEFTGTMVHDDLENACKSIFAPLGINYSISNGKIVFD